MQNKEYDAFISYNSRDLPFVKEAVAMLTYYGMKCWFQLNESKQNFSEAIVTGLKASKSFILFLSKNSAKSYYVNSEINYAVKLRNRDHNFKIVPVIIDDIDMNDEEYDHLDFTLGSLNYLFLKDHPTTNGLALKIIDQLDFKIIEQQKRNIYSADSDVEASRLKIQSRYYSRYAGPVLKNLLDKYENPHILDVGCSNPECIIGRIGDSNYTALLGIDIAEGKIMMANDLYGNDKNEFLVCDITKEESIEIFKDYFKKHNIKGFDVIHMSSVLLHLKNPAKVLEFLRTLLVEGGSLLLLDEDDGLNVAYPKSTYFEDVFFCYVHSLEAGDRECGRKLSYLMNEAGYKNINLFNTMCCSDDFAGEYRQELWDLYFNPEYWEVSDASYFDDLRAVDCLERCKKNYKEVFKSYMNGEYFLSLGIFIYTAEK